MKLSSTTIGVLILAALGAAGIAAAVEESGIKAMMLIVSAALFGLAGYGIGSPRGRSILGAILGTLLGPLGLIGLALFPQQSRCPECGEFVRSEARKCKHCGSAISLDPENTTTLQE